VHSVAEPTEQAPAEPAARFDELFLRFYPELFGLAYRVLGDRMAGEDVLQEAFLALSAEPALLDRPDAEVGAWLRRVVMHRAFNSLRSERRARLRLERFVQLDGAAASDAAAASADVLKREEQAEVRRALADLPERQRACLLLRHSGYSYAEIAATLGVATGSVGVLLGRAEAAFRLSYRRHEQA
jgi:RNA polymerase sigma-70 factor (ECF subfamily)